MALQLILLHRNQKTSSSSSPLLLLLLLLWLTTTSAALSLAKAGCQEECGNVTIPYPFGIGAGCYFDERYSVECRNNNNTPYFKSIDLEVLFISVYDNFVGVNNPVIISPNCHVVNNNNGSSNSTSLVSGVVVDLRSSPFLISSTTGNIFVTVGCNDHAVMTDLYNNNPIAECSSPSCNSNSTKNISSCRAYIQLDGQSLQGFNATFTNTTSGSGEQSPCSTYAFLLYNGFNVTDYSMAVQNGTTTHVPVSLDWTFNRSVPIEDKYNSTTCYNFSSTISSSNGSSSVIEIFQCYCKFSNGNPYLPNGCIVDCSQAPYQPWCHKSKLKMVIIG